MKHESNDSGGQPSWATEQLPEINELEVIEAREKAARFAKTQAEQEALAAQRAQEAERDAKQREMDRRVNSFASEMVRLTYEKLKGVSAAPDTTLTVKLKPHHHDVYKLPDVKLARVWEVLTYKRPIIDQAGPYGGTIEHTLLEGLWLDGDGILRTNRFNRDWELRYDERTYGRKSVDPPIINFDSFYPPVFWSRSNKRPLEPINLQQPWVFDMWTPRFTRNALPRMLPLTISPDYRGLPYKLPDEPVHCQQCGPEIPLVHVGHEAGQKDPHASLLARHLTQLMRRYNAL
jgi:hypothetical protein